MSADESGGAMRQRAVEHGGVFAAYFALALVLTYPVVRSAHHAIPMDPQIQGWYPGDGDPWHYVWGFWLVQRALSTFPPQLLWTDLVFFPLGFEIPFLPGVGLVLGPGALLAALGGLVLAYNVVWWASFAFAGYAMYLLSRHLGVDRAAAFACGILFAFSSYRMIHAVEHLPIVAASGLVPLFALTLLRAAIAPTPGRAASCALVLAASTGVSWYTTVHLVVLLAVAGAVALRQAGLRGVRAVPLRPVAVGAAAFALATAPFVLPLLLSPARDSIVNRPLVESSVYSADLLAFFAPSPRNPVFGALTAPLYDRFTGNPYEQTVYLGYVLLALAFVGVRSATRDETRLFRATALTAFLLALGPFLHVAGASRFAIEDHTLSVPLPYLVLHYIPFVRGARVPSRFVELLVLALVVLAGYGLARLCAGLSASRKAGVVAALVALALLETALVPVPTVSARAPAIYAEMGRTGDPSTVLEVPLDQGIIKYHYYQTIHGKRLIVGNPVRPREKYATYPTGVPLMPAFQDPTRLVGRPDPADARRDAARLIEFFEIRHIVIHGEWLDPAAFERLDRFVGDNFPHVARTVDGQVVAYRLRPPDPAQAAWPERYVVDFGSPRREFALLTGWAVAEQWGDLSVQWSSERESSMLVHLGDPVARVLEARLRPLTYPGSPTQTVGVYVNGTLRERLVLAPEWTVYRLSLPAAAFRRGRNTVTFEYGHTIVPARALPGNPDPRRLAVAFDYVVLAPGR